MIQWRTVLITLGFIILCFLAIPIKINNVEIVEERVLFDDFIKSYNKTYNASSDEYETRFKIFQESLEQIKILNAERYNSSSTAIYGITNFSDISSQEFDDKYLMYEHKGPHERKHSSHKRHHNRIQRSYDEVPRSVDWRKKGFVTSIKNQKTCGACWAFSTVGTVESMLAIKTGKLISLSTQEAIKFNGTESALGNFYLIFNRKVAFNCNYKRIVHSVGVPRQIIDCARNGNMGCDGGDTCTLLQWLVGNNVGIQEEKDYPLVLQTETCKLKQTDKGVHVASNYSCDYLVGDEDSILHLLAYHGPVAVAVNALSWQFYVGGIIQFHCDGSLQNLNHAVQLVGYNLDSTPPYYIARNSWGKNYGEKGYLRIAVGSNVCGIASEVASLDVA